MENILTGTERQSTQLVGGEDTGRSKEANSGGSSADLLNFTHGGGSEFLVVIESLDGVHLGVDSLALHFVCII